LDTVHIEGEGAVDAPSAGAPEGSTNGDGEGGAAAPPPRPTLRRISVSIGITADGSREGGVDVPAPGVVLRPVVKMRRD